jgi:hypothetical protein
MGRSARSEFPWRPTFRKNQTRDSFGAGYKPPNPRPLIVPAKAQRFRRLGRTPPGGFFHSEFQRSGPWLSVIFGGSKYAFNVEAPTLQSNSTPFVSGGIVGPPAAFFLGN